MLRALAAQQTTLVLLYLDDLSPPRVLSLAHTRMCAVSAIFVACEMVGIGAASIGLNALRFPPSSRITTFSLTPISLAFATAASTIFCASSKEMLCFFTRLGIGHLPSLTICG